MRPAPGRPSGAGTTTIVDFGTQYPGETLAAGLKNWHEKADGKCSCDYGFHMSITDWNPSVSREIDDMMEEGVSSFKLYMTYDTQVDDETIFAILRRLKEARGDHRGALREQRHDRRPPGRGQSGGAHGRVQPPGYPACGRGGGGHRPACCALRRWWISRWWWSI